MAMGTGVAGIFQGGGAGYHGELAEREPITGVWERSPHAAGYGGKA